jgi:hypothetical protein
VPQGPSLATLLRSLDLEREDDIPDPRGLKRREATTLGVQVRAGATAMCSFGMAPSTIADLPVNMVMTGSPAGNIADCAPVMNIPPPAGTGTQGMGVRRPNAAAVAAGTVGLVIDMQAPKECPRSISIATRRPCAPGAASFKSLSRPIQGD